LRDVVDIHLHSGYILQFLDIFSEIVMRELQDFLQNTIDSDPHENSAFLRLEVAI